MIPLHQNPAPSLWTGRPAETIEYWHQAIITVNDLAFNESSDSKKIGILGYEGDEGVHRNGGRIGAALGPDAIRKVMGSTAYHLKKGTQILDYGTIQTENQEMESSHALISKSVSSLLRTKHFPVLFGGGHDLAYAHATGIFDYLKGKDEKLGIINLDAHFDLRPKVNNQGHSGSPFYQLSQEHSSHFHYFCLGIQRAANPSSLFETAKQTKATFIEMEEFQINKWDLIQEKILWFLDSVNKVYLSIDLDGFSSAYAPGVSAPSPLGFNPDLAFKIFDLIASSKKLISLDVVELNPTFDQDQATARLAARCTEYILRKVFG
ncbi:formimidoylglutamase [Algoriphagus namhaensis]|uniref:Formimidoylglutamase n=1 Tax=Algoriphagus namhaensis TaxID=915353 RepID=A0ABV8AV65_9BACT